MLYFFNRIHVKSNRVNVCTKTFHRQHALITTYLDVHPGHVFTGFYTTFFRLSRRSMKTYQRHITHFSEILWEHSVPIWTFIYYLHVICLSITNDSNGYKKFEFISCFVGGMNIKSKCFTSIYTL